jgi:hypothetical protein
MQDDLEAARTAMNDASRRFRDLDAMFLTTDRIASDAALDADHLISMNERPMAIIAELEGRPQTTRSAVRIQDVRERTAEKKLALIVGQKGQPRMKSPSGALGFVALPHG